MSKRIFASDLLPPATGPLELAPNRAERLPGDLTFISLGYRCEVAWQIRHHFAKPAAYPFDWLATPMQTLPLMIEENFARIADPGLLRVVRYARGWTVQNEAYQCLLLHEFRREPNGDLAADWRDDIPRVKDKFDFLRQRWRTLSRASGSLVFCRRLGNLAMPAEAAITTTPDDYTRLQRALQQAFPWAQVNLIFIDCDGVPESASCSSVRIGPPDAADGPDDCDYWKGRTSGYRHVFERVSQV